VSTAARTREVEVMDLQALLDERAITRALSRFARIADAKTFDELGEIFADDVTFDYGAGHDEHGLDTLRGLLRRHLGSCGGTQHLIGSIVVDVHGDHAVSRAYIQARHQRVGELFGPVFDSNGEYVDRWERRAQGWRIVRRDARWAANSGDPAIISADGKLG
jgi:ketosteroid isomerase-like protein